MFKGCHHRSTKKNFLAVVFSKEGFIHSWRPAGSSLCLHSLPTRSQWGRACCRTVQRYGLCQTAQCPCLGTSCSCTPLASQILQALTANRHNTVSAAGSPPVLQRGFRLFSSHEHKQLKASVSY